MIRDELVYRAILRAYPARFRRDYEREMMLVFRDQRRDGAVRDLSYWTALVVDVLRNAPHEWREEFLENVRPAEMPMRAFAAVAVLVSVFELLNAALEVQAGGFAMRDALTQTGIVVVLLSVVALLTTCIGLLRGRTAQQFAGIAAGGCIASFTFMGLVRPTFSVLAMLVGIGFPLALIVWIVVHRRRGATATNIGNVA